MEISLDGKVALVTGGSQGIGKAIAAAFAEAGARVLISSRKQDALEQAAAEIGHGTIWYAANAGEPDQAKACIDHTVAELGGLDILVNNAAANPYYGPTIDVDLGRYDKTFQVNLRGPLVWTQLARDAGIRAGGSVLNISSVGAFIVEHGLGVYNITKSALIHLTRQLAFELAPDVRVNAIAPGLVKTSFARALWEANEEGIAKTTPMRRLGLPEDIGNAALFLVSDMASWLTGHTLVVDGGAQVRPSAG